MKDILSFLVVVRAHHFFEFFGDENFHELIKFVMLWAVRNIGEYRIAVSHYNHGLMSIFAYLVAVSSEAVAEIFSGGEILVLGC